MMTNVSQEALAELHPIERELIARDQAAQEAGTPMTLDQLQAEVPGHRGRASRAARARRQRLLARRWRAGGTSRPRRSGRPRSSRPTRTTTAASSCSTASGPQRYLDPPLMAVLLALRRRLVEEHGAETAAELMMVDMAVLSLLPPMRVTGWIGDFSQWLESEFFRKGSLTVRPHEMADGKIGVKVRGLRVEEIVERLAEKLMPLLDRSNRMMLRNLKALREYRRPPTPSVSIGQAGQVNVAAVQTNQTDRRRHDGAMDAGDA